MASNRTSPEPADNISESSSSPKIKDEILDEILMCGICLSRMSSPCCLPCAHSFCRSCLIDYAQNNNNIDPSTPTNFILCPYCKYQLNFRSFEHFESMLIINPILKQLCEALNSSKLNSEQQAPSNGVYRARCHTCCLLQMLKICKHCHFMLCETCRRTHLLDVHRESKIQLELLHSRLDSINKKRLEMDQQVRDYDFIRQRIQNYVQHFIHEIEQQRDQALRILHERQHSNDERFWTGTGFDNREKFEFFHSLLQSGQKKLTARNITDKELIELSDNLQTMPDVDENSIECIQFSRLVLELEETLLTKQFICVSDQSPATDQNEKSIHDNKQTDCISS